jgi:hypothetical protein
MSVLPPKRLQSAGRLSGWFRAARRVAVVLMLMSAVVFGIWRWQLHREVRAQVAAIRAEGYPTNWKELKSWPLKISAEENAALIYVDAIDRLEEDSKGEIGRKEIPRRGDMISEKDITFMIATVERASAALALAYSVTNPSVSRYPVDYEEGLNAQLPHLKGLKHMAQILGWEAILKARNGDALGAVGSLNVSLNLSQSLDQEPLLISQLSSSAILAITSANLEHVLCRLTLSEEQLITLENRFREVEQENRILTGLIGERANINELIRLGTLEPAKLVETSNAQNGEDGVDVPGRKLGILSLVSGFFERDQNYFLRAMETNIAIARLGPPASIARSNELFQITERAMSRYYFMSSVFLSAFSYTANRDAGTRARLRLAITALAVERWRHLHNGSLPETLNDLVPAVLPAVPIDPFDGQPLRFRKVPKGYLLYSIDQNLKDDGGNERPLSSVFVPKEQRNKYDITFTVER